jgi:CheY-like chemotaxis protein
MYTIGLIVQDSDNRQVFTFWLEDAGYRVAAFADEGEMLRAVHQGEVLDLLVVESPVRKMWSRDCEPMVWPTLKDMALPVVGLVPDVVRQDGTSWPFDEYLVKPTDLYDLLTLCQSIYQRESRMPIGEGVAESFGGFMLVT